MFEPASGPAVLIGLTALPIARRHYDIGPDTLSVTVTDCEQVDPLASRYCGRSKPYVLAPNVRVLRGEEPLPLGSCRPIPRMEVFLNLGIELGREVSAGAYLLKRRSELPLDAEADAVLAAIETGIALEILEFGRARQSWRLVVEAVERLGRSARREGLTPRRLVARIGRVRDAVDLVLFDGRLPSDLAATAARTAAKMFARATERALLTYWDQTQANGRP